MSVPAAFGDLGANLGAAVASTLLANELHRRLTFHASAGVGWLRAQVQGGGLAVVGLVASSLALVALDGAFPSAGWLVQVLMVGGINGAIGLVRFVALRAWVIHRRAVGSIHCGVGSAYSCQPDRRRAVSVHVHVPASGAARGRRHATEGQKCEKHCDDACRDEPAEETRDNSGGARKVAGCGRRCGEHRDAKGRANFMAGHEETGCHARVLRRYARHRAD
ncbi:MAG: GtrA family protein [Geodermatophilaceae bacterium]